ncbi:MAG: OmpA family protein [Ilumatobacter sp.]|uniref:OmpA family protein n=1 Tax=Ilumatobacter sp. TaxID=1967498 RepID=UPI003C7184E1
MGFDDDDDYDDDDREWPMWAGGVVAVVVSAAVLWFGIGAITGGGDETAQLTASRPATEPSVTVATTEAPEITTTRPESTSVQATTAPTAPTGTTGTTGTTTSSTLRPAGPVSYETLADGSPVPVLVIFDDELVTISGVVPSESAAERLRVLALANSTVRGAQVASFVTINPDVPIGVGVRMIEANSPQFDEGLPTISLEYIAQLDRIASLMSSLPTITVEVIGHTDQTVDDDSNLDLSTERARLAADYIESQGIDPARLSSRGAGSDDLLTLNNDEAALALNRRTEFVVSGLLVEGS